MRQNKSMRPKVLGPYTEADVTKWNEALALCEQALQQCQLANQAGFPCQDQEQACAALRDQLQQMKATYAPGYP